MTVIHVMSCPILSMYIFVVFLSTFTSLTHNNKVSILQMSYHYTKITVVCLCVREAGVHGTSFDPDSKNVLSSHNYNCTLREGVH